MTAEGKNRGVLPAARGAKVRRFERGVPEEAYPAEADPPKPQPPTDVETPKPQVPPQRNNK